MSREEPIAASTMIKLYELAHKFIEDNHIECIEDLNIKDINTKEFIKKICKLVGFCKEDDIVN